MSETKTISEREVANQRSPEAKSRLGAAELTVLAAATGMASMQVIESLWQSNPEMIAVAGVAVGTFALYKTAGRGIEVVRDAKTRVGEALDWIADSKLWRPREWDWNKAAGGVTEIASEGVLELGRFARRQTLERVMGVYKKNRELVTENGQVREINSRLKGNLEGIADLAIRGQLSLDVEEPGIDPRLGKAMLDMWSHIGAYDEKIFRLPDVRDRLFVRAMLINDACKREVNSDDTKLLAERDYDLGNLWKASNGLMKKIAGGEDKVKQTRGDARRYLARDL